jgi:hypothetical protein
MVSFVVYLQHLVIPLLIHPRLAKLITSTVWFWVTCQTLHFMGVSVLIGVVGFFDIRLLGGWKRVPLGAAMDLMPWAIVAFVVNLITGSIFILGRPGIYAHSISLWFKLLFVILAGLNALFFQLTLKRKALELKPTEDTPVFMKLVGATSLFSWFAVLYFGRMVPYLGRF